ncbi:sulfotransferase [Roseobacter cerasinus]|nr:sulfotransferase [Roseobacter cerasinus]
MPASTDETRPVFLSGVYRSGTTFLTAVVNNIPAIAAASSTVKYLRFCYPHFSNPADPAELRRLLEQTNERVSKRWGLHLSEEAVSSQLSDGQITHSRVYDAIMQSLLVADKPGATRWAEKLAAQWRDIPLFLEMFPKGQVVHVMRDPRDVTASYKKMTYEPWPTYLDAALNCKGAMMELPNLQRTHGTDRILILRAEDLATNLPGEMCKICEFLGEPYVDDMADLSRFSEIKGEAWRTNTSFEETGDNYSKATSRWERHLDPEEVFLVEMICQPDMAAFGYEGSGLDMAAISAERLGQIFADPWFASRMSYYLTHGRPMQGYRTDPYQTEMEIVFGAARG